jgi:hypothetical protein
MSYLIKFQMSLSGSQRAYQAPRGPIRLSEGSIMISEGPIRLSEGSIRLSEGPIRF